MDNVISELVSAATIMNAPPSAVGLDQRKQAENFLLKFKKSDKPYAICKKILESSEDPYLHFLASSTLKEGIMREWVMLGDTEIDQLRDYLLNYTHHHLHSQTYVIRQMLHVVALIVKRSLLSRDPSYLQSFITSVCALFKSPVTINLGLEIAGALLAEFTVADKTMSSYMSYQHNLDCKKAIESDGLYQIFVSTVEVINQLRSAAPVEQHRKEWIQIMGILYSVLSWDFGIILSKRLAQMSSLNLSVINLMPGAQWSVLKGENVLSLLVELYRVFARDSEIQHYARLCIVQLGTLQGSIFDNQEERVTFLSRYITALSELVVRACELPGSDEDHGLALAVRQLLWANTSQDLKNIHLTLFRDFLSALTEFSIKVFLRSANDEEDSTQDVVDVILDIWLTLNQMLDTLPRSPLDMCMLRVVECYLNCHLAPPAGIRGDATDISEVDVDTEEDDRVKYRDQLDIVGNLARVNIATTLKHYNNLLLERTRRLRAVVDAQEECNPLFEDLHWLVLLLGYTLSDAHTESDPTIPSPILDYLAKCQSSHQTDLDNISQYTQKCVGQCGDLPPLNDVMGSILVLVDLAAVYQDLLSKGGRNFLSPQVYSSLIWSLTRIFASFLMPNEQEYEFFPQPLLCLVEESPIARWMVGFSVEKVISGVLFYSGEQGTIEDCIALVQIFAKNPRISAHLMANGNFQKLVERYTQGELTLSSSKANKMLANSLTTAMSHLPVSDQRPFMDRVFGPIRDRTVQLLGNKADVVKISNSPLLIQQLLTALDTFYGISTAIICKTVDVVSSTLMPVLEGCVMLMEKCQHVQPITSSILELYCVVSDGGILHMDKAQTNMLYDTCYRLLKCYSDAAPSKGAAIVGLEDDRYDNILLCLELLSHLCSKDFFVLDEPEEQDDTPSKLVLVGLDIIVPHIDIDLLKFPELSSAFFKLITFICEVYPEKVVGLPDNVLDQIVLMLKVGLNNYNDDITFYIFNAVSALALHSQENFIFQRKIGQIIKHTLLLISGQELSAELYDSAADMVFSFICKCREEYLVIVNEIVVEQPDSASQECLRSAFSALIPNTTNISRRDKGKFSKIFENFAVNVYGICR